MEKFKNNSYDNVDLSKFQEEKDFKAIIPHRNSTIKPNSARD